MSAMDMDALTAAFKSHTEGQERFTRRMAIALADMDGTTPKQIVLRCERLGLLKPGSWDWFKVNGGITAEQVQEVRREITDQAARNGNEHARAQAENSRHHTPANLSKRL